MSPEMVRAIGYLVGEAYAAGADLREIAEAANEKGEIPPEIWEGVVEEVRAANRRWDSAGEGED